MYAQIQTGLQRGRALIAMLVVAAGGSLMVMAADAPASAPETPPAAAPASGTTASNASGGTAANGDAQSSLTGDLGTLEYILSLSPERLSALRKALENVEKMPQAERDALRREIQNRRQNLGQLMQEIRPDQQQLSASDRNVLQQYLLTLYTNEIKALLARFHAISAPDERKQIIQEMLKTAADKGIKPNLSERGPPLGGQRGNPPGGRNGRNGPGASGNNGRGGQRNGYPPRPPVPGPAPIPTPVEST